MVLAADLGELSVKVHRMVSGDTGLDLPAWLITVPQAVKPASAGLGGWSWVGGAA